MSSCADRAFLESAAADADVLAQKLRGMFPSESAPEQAPEQASEAAAPEAAPEQAPNSAAPESAPVTQEAAPAAQESELIISRDTVIPATSYNDKLIYGNIIDILTQMINEPGKYNKKGKSSDVLNNILNEIKSAQNTAQVQGILGKYSMKVIGKSGVRNQYFQMAGGTRKRRLIRKRVRTARRKSKTIKKH